MNLIPDSSNVETWLAFDKEHVWHPYTSMIDPLPVYPVVSAKGVRLRLADGTELIDGMSSWWCAIHGYNHPQINGALVRQMESMSHVMFGGITHPSAVECASLLLKLAPKPLSTVFLCDSGSVAVEVAIKMAIQYWHAKGLEKKKKLLTIQSGYHGDTLGAMSVCDPVTGMHTLFSGILPRQFFALSPACGFDDPWDETHIADFRALLEKHQDEIAAVILEPVVQGAGGMRFYSPRYLSRVRELCDQNSVLLIADEIATGFGRTGKMFACEHASIVPDIMCLGKALTGGTMTLAAVLATSGVSRTISSGNPGVFMHGPTFMANPLACACACASMRLLVSSPWQQRVKNIEAGLKTGLSPCSALTGVRDVRVLGAIGVVETKRPVDVAAMQRLFVKKGVWVRPFARLVYLMPPFIISGVELAKLCAAVCEVVEEWDKGI